MKVELEKTFPVPGSPEVAWELLQNIEAVAGCMPGAAITERLPDGRYKGNVKVRIGPATMAFRGELEVRDIDAATRSLRLLAKGTDSTGTSGAAMDIAARVESVSDGTSNLVGKCEVSMSGKAAAFGGRMMNSVAEQILKQFADNFAAQATARMAQRGATAAREEMAARSQLPPATTRDATPSAAATTASQATTPPPASAETAATAATPAPDDPPAPPPARELNGLALLWAVIKDWLRGLFPRKAA